MRQAGPPTKPGLEARRAAVGMLWDVLEEQRQLSELTDGLERLSASDRARAQRLATETLRHLGRCDAVLEQFLKKRPPTAVMNILRLATLELCHDRAAAHGVVDAAVTLMRKAPKGNHYAGLANAVLRRVSETAPEAWADLPASSLRKWLRRRLVHIYDEETVLAFEAAHAQGAAVDLSVKSQEAVADLDGEFLPTGAFRLATKPQITELPGYAEGEIWVQDAAAQLPVRLLAPQTGERILDLCAAPGGKTLQLAAAGADVTALDISEARLARVSENLERTGLTAALVAADARSWAPDATYDAVLLDAPCSATGTIRRHPDLPYAKNGRDLDQLFDLQSELIDRSLGFLKPGGRLIYCTCSLLSEEGERQAKSAIERHDLEPIPQEIPGVPADWATPEGGIRTRPDLWPEYGGLDGFYMIALRKR